MNRKPYTSHMVQLIARQTDSTNYISVVALMAINCPMMGQCRLYKESTI